MITTKKSSTFILLLFASIFLIFNGFYIQPLLAAEKSRVYIEVGKAKVKRSLLAMPSFNFFGTKALNKKHRMIKKELYDTIAHDLEVSSYFYFINKSAFLEKTSETSLQPNYSDKAKGFSFEKWAPLEADFLIRGGFSLDGEKINLEVYLYHVPSRKLVFGKNYTASKKSLRKIAHKFSNDVLEKLTGKRGMFNSQVVASSDRGGGRHKEIYTMDWDAHNIKPITRHRSISISPSWSEDHRYIAYTAFKSRKRSKKWNADLYLYDAITKKHRPIVRYPGVNSGAAFIPGTNDLMITTSKGGRPDIYRININGSVKQQLTSGPRKAMNVEPALSPDGKEIAFSSDRSGRPMIYVMPIDRTKSARMNKPKRIVFAGWYNASPSWSPDGKKIAFAGYDKTLKHFDIFLMNKNGTGLIRLTTAKKINKKYSNNEDPTFSPDGRHVMFISDRTGKKQIYIVNVDGSNERRITFDEHNYFKPKWSQVR